MPPGGNSTMERMGGSWVAVEAVGKPDCVRAV